MADNSPLKSTHTSKRRRRTWGYRGPLEHLARLNAIALVMQRCQCSPRHRRQLGIPRTPRLAAATALAGNTDVMTKADTL